MPEMSFTRRHREGGFTLVELAISLTVIGLLMVALLKGQEIVINARANSLMRQVKSFDAGVAVFMDSYGFYPGDIRNPQGVLNACTAALCNAGGNGDGLVKESNAARPEIYNFFPHMSRAGVIQQEIPGAASLADANANNNLVYAQTVYSTLVSISHFAPTPGVDQEAHYYRIPGLPFKILYQIDRKLDDQIPDKGRVRTSGAGCPVIYSAPHVSNMYDLNQINSNSNTCWLSIKAEF